VVKPPRLVIDTNIMLRAVAHRASASGQIVAACERRTAIVLLSKDVLVEYLTVLRDPEVISRQTAITAISVENTLKRLRYVADRYEKTTRFVFSRDPRDEPFIELAIAGAATHVVTNDKDLLSLPTARTDAGKRFRQRLPNLSVLRPDDFVRAFPALFPE
jgi:uncharacterized protein